MSVFHRHRVVVGLITHQGLRTILVVRLSQASCGVAGKASNFSLSRAKRSAMVSIPRALS